MVKILLMLLCITGCSTTKYKVIHKPLTIPVQCEFEKFSAIFTVESLLKESLESAECDTKCKERNSALLKHIDDTGKKIARNQDNCRTRQIRIDSLIKAHNKAHEDKQ